MYKKEIKKEVFDFSAWKIEEKIFYYIGECPEFKDCVIYATDPENKNTYTRLYKSKVLEIA